LEKRGIVIPGIDKLDVGPMTSNELRFFRENQREEANKIVGILQSLDVQGTKMKYIPGYENSTTIGRRDYQLWFTPGPTLSKAALSEAEIRAWLETYQRAFQEKNVDDLVELGVFSRTEAARVRDGFGNYKDYRVALQNVEIRSEGNQATVTFTRVDTINGKVMQPLSLVFTIVKQTDGRISSIRFR
jgi:hypothetical protein